MFKKKRSIKWANFFNIDEMVHYQIIPDYDINNSNNIAVTNAMSNIFKTPLERLNIDIKGVKVTYKLQSRCYFNIVMEKRQASFYISIPVEHEHLILNKLETVWNHAEIRKVDTVESFNIDNSEVCDLVLKDYNFKSLRTDTRDLYPLTNMLGVTRDLLDGEGVRVSFAFKPLKRRNWSNIAKDEYKRFKKGIVVDNEITTGEEITKVLWKVLELAINTYIEFNILLFECIMGLFITHKEEEKETIEIKIDSLEAIKEENKAKYLSDSTTYKMSSVAFDTRINVISCSKDAHRRKTNMITVANSFKDLTADNELVVKKLDRKEQIKAYNEAVNFKAIFVPRKRNVFSDREVAKFIQLPQKSLQEEYKIERIDTREVEVPSELTDGGIPIGIAEIKGKEVLVNWCNDYNVRALPKIVGGPQGAGKTEFTVNFIVGAHKIGDGSFTFDFIKNCDLTQSAIKHIKNPVLIDMSDEENLFAFAYPEVSSKINENTSPWDRIKIASEIAQQLKYFVNAISDGDSNGPLSTHMSKYLVAAAKVVFIHPGEVIDNVFRVLEDWQIRNEYIRRTKDVYDYNHRTLNLLRELNDMDDKGKIVGTRTHLINGISSRISVLLDDPRLEKMLQAPIDKHNFTDYMNEGRAVFIMMPQKEFKDPVVKDILVTYFMTRIRMASLERCEIDKPRMCHVITDEVKQVPTACAFLEKHITEFRKFGIAPYFTMHYFKQFKTLLEAVKNAGTSYMLLAGTEEENLQILSKQIAPFTVEECLNMKPFTSINVINYGNQYAKFMSKLPPQLE